MVDLRNITYLREGTLRQREMCSCLDRYEILKKVAEFDPVIVSTICANVDTPSSDIDIACYAKDGVVFHRALKSRFGTFPQFKIGERDTPYRAITASFRAEPFEIEIFGAPVPVEKQNGYRHLSTLLRLIRLGGEKMRYDIQSAKLSGLKTEPAIAKLLSLPGDPFQAVLELEECSDSELKSMIERRSSGAV